MKVWMSWRLGAPFVFPSKGILNVACWAWRWMSAG